LIFDYYRNLRNWIALEVKYSKEEKYNVEYLRQLGVAEELKKTVFEICQFDG